MSEGGNPFKPKGPFGSAGSDTPDVYLNLTPLMDVMSNILFFLMAAFGAASIAVIPSTIPAQSFGETSIEVEEDKVTVSLRADANGFTMSPESQTLTPDQLKPYKAFLPKLKDGQYDYAQLRARLFEIKKKWPGSSTMILVPDDNMLYDLIVKIMDAARDQTMPDNRVVTLFPEVVLSSIYSGEKK